MGLLIFYLLMAYLLMYTTYLFVFALAGRLSGASVPTVRGQSKNALIVIPAYKEDQVILSSVHKALAHNYAGGNVHILVIADHLKPGTVNALQNLPITVCCPNFVKSSKIKSLQHALRYVHDSDYDFVLLLDADNVMADGVLDKVNEAIAAGCEVAQLHRTAKNSQISLAVLDGANEVICNHIFRRGARAMGFSSALIGSGIAFTTSYYKHIIPLVPDSMVEDKGMESQMLKDKVKIHFLEGVYIFDEKVSEAANFIRQRTRWVLGMLVGVQKYLMMMPLAIKTRNKDLLHKCFQGMLLPKSLLVIVLMLCIGASGFISLQSFIVSLSAAALFMVTMLISLPKIYYHAKLSRVILGLPGVIVMMALALVKALDVKENFIHTRHSYTEPKESPKV